MYGEAGGTIAEVIVWFRKMFRHWQRNERVLLSIPVTVEELQRDKLIKISGRYTCITSQLIYSISCRQCPEIVLLNIIIKKVALSGPEHFTKPNQNLSDMMSRATCDKKEAWRRVSCQRGTFKEKKFAGGNKRLAIRATLSPPPAATVGL